MQVDQLKKIKRRKSTLEKDIKMLQNRSEKIPSVQQNKRVLKLKNLIKNNQSKLHYI